MNSRLVAALIAAAKANLKPVPGSHRHAKFTLSHRTLELMGARRKAHAAWLSNRTPVSRTLRNKLNRQTDRAVQLDLLAYTDQQAVEAEAALAKGNVRGWSKMAKQMTGKTSSTAAYPKAMKDTQGKIQHGDAAVLEVLTSHFESLLGGKSSIGTAQLNQLAAVAAEHGLQHEGEEDHGRPPDPSETAAAVRALRRAAAAGSDRVDASLLRAGKPILDWIHLAVCAAWKSCKCPKEWRVSIITSLYKNKGPKDSSSNYQGISHCQLLAKCMPQSFYIV